MLCSVDYPLATRKMESVDIMYSCAGTWMREVSGFLSSIIPGMSNMQPAINFYYDYYLFRSMAKLRVDYEALKIRCHHLESKLSSAGTEVVNLRKQHSDAQENIASLRANVCYS